MRRPRSPPQPRGPHPPRDRARGCRPSAPPSRPGPRPGPRSKDRKARGRSPRMDEVRRDRPQHLKDLYSCRLPNVSTPGGETGGVEWTAVDETERRNRLFRNRLEPEVPRHQPLGKRVSSEFESLPPSHPSLALRAFFGPAFAGQVHRETTDGRSCLDEAAPEPASIRKASRRRRGVRSSPFTRENSRNFRARGLVSPPGRLGVGRRHHDLVMSLRARSIRPSIDSSTRAGSRPNSPFTSSARPGT